MTRDREKKPRKEPVLEEAERLRLRIARSRRRIDRHVRAVGGQGRRLTSWRAYVAQYPGYATLAALGAGLIVSAGLNRGGLMRWIGGLFVGRSVRQVTGRFFDEFERILTESKSDRTGRGGDDD